MMNYLAEFLLLFLPLYLKVTPCGSIPYKTFRAENPVKIGLLVTSKNSLSAVYAAELAVSNANKAGGLNGRPFQLEVRSLEGPWGTGSKQAVDLIFNEKVWALIGSHDGRNAHLIEQAATKATVVFLSCWAGDPSLSQAFVPWFFNCVHNDEQQASIIVSLITDKNRSVRITAVTDDDDYDSRVSFASLKKNLERTGKLNLLVLESRKYNNDFKSLAEKIKESSPDYILIYCRPQISSDILLQMKNQKINQPVIGPAHTINEDILSPADMKHFDNFFLTPSDKWAEEAFKRFKADYEKKYGISPGPVASYMYDGMNVLIEAIRKAGNPDREKIQKTLYEIDYKGITGRIRFDQRGNRNGILELEKTVSGIPAPSLQTSLPK
ncbi:MAG: ABC transporter substrate-binding protein [Bacteroidales bacterium]|nr:ABC transporter substrate-binding protein [Bacteroidales bacterium]